MRVKINNTTHNHKDITVDGIVTHKAVAYGGGKWEVYTADGVYLGMCYLNNLTQFVLDRM